MSAATIVNTSAGLARAWYPVATVDEVGTDPIGVRLLGQPWAIARLDSGLVAFEDRCPHRRAPLSIGINHGSTLQCRYHGWHFAPDGRCVTIPSLGDAAAVPSRACATAAAGVIERYGLVWLAPEPPVADLPAFSEWSDDTYDVSRNEPRRSPASAFALVDNFLDATHLPTVHTQTFGVADAGFLPDHDVHSDDWRASTTYQVSYRNYDDPLVATGEHPLVQPQELYKEFVAATTALIRLDFPLTGRRIAILFALQPEHDGSTRIYKQMARNDLDGDVERIKASVEFEDLVLDEDLAVLEAYHDHAFPIDQRVEIHVRTDKLSLAYRRMLRTLVG